MSAATKQLRPKVRREIKGGRVSYRGVDRPVIALLDTQAGTITVRLKGCRKSKVYQLTDLATWGPQLAFNF